MRRTIYWQLPTNGQLQLSEKFRIFIYTVVNNLIAYLNAARMLSALAYSISVDHLLSVALLFFFNSPKFPSYICVHAYFSLLRGLVCI